MSETKFTPGPWDVQRPGWVALDDLVNIEGRNWGVVADSFGNCLHHVVQRTGEANAYLISAAPDLYAACERTLEELRPDSPEEYALMEQLKAALQKAQGVVSQ